MKLTLRRIILLTVFILLVVIARPLGFLIYTYYKDKEVVKVERAGYSNDASHLNETSIGHLVKIPQADEFFLLKKKYDSAEVFKNQFYETYK